MSARELKYKFSHAGEEISISGVDLEEVNSPELPSSVSRSRGKHYNGKKWEGIDLNILFDKQKGLSKRGFQQGSRFGREVKPKSKSIVNQPKGLLSGKLKYGFEHYARGKTEYMAGNPVSSSSSDHRTGGSTAKSTITSENSQKYRELSRQPVDQKKSSSVRKVTLGKSFVTRKVSSIQPQKKSLEVSSQSCDQKSRSSSVISVRRSYVSGKATSKVEVGGDSMQPRGRKSSSGKSSVGSCSNPGYEVKFLSRKQRGKIADEKGEVTMNLAVRNHCKAVEEEKSGNRKGSIINFAKPAYHRTAKSLVRSCTVLKSRVFLSCYA